MTSATSTAKRSLRSSEMQAFVALLERDVRVLGKNIPGFLLRTIMQPLLFTFLFAYVFPKTGQGIGRGAVGGGHPFSTVLVPGLIALACIFQGVQAVAFPLTQEFSYTKEIEDRVLAPLPVWAVGVGKIANGAVQAIFAALIVFPIVALVHAKGQAPSVHVDNWLTLIVVLLLSSLLGASFGLLIGAGVEPRQVPLIFSGLVLPMSMLGCVYYPWAFLSSIPWLKYFVLVNPLVYMSEGFRTALTPDVPHMNPAAFLTAMVLATAAFTLLSLRSFRKRVVA